MCIFIIVPALCLLINEYQDGTHEDFVFVDHFESVDPAPGVQSRAINC